MPTKSAGNQERLFYEAHKRLADANNAFLEAVADGLTREDLEKLIQRRPSLWGRYEHWLKTLPSATAQRGT